MGASHRAIFPDNVLPPAGDPEFLAFTADLEAAILITRASHALLSIGSSAIPCMAQTVRAFARPPVRWRSNHASTSISRKRQYFPNRKPGIRSIPRWRVRSYTQDTGTLSNSATSSTVRRAAAGQAVGAANCVSVTHTSDSPFLFGGFPGCASGPHSTSSRRGRLATPKGVTKFMQVNLRLHCASWLVSNPYARCVSNCRNPHQRFGNAEGPEAVG